MLMVKMRMVKIVIFNSCDVIGKQNPKESEIDGTRGRRIERFRYKGIYLQPRSRPFDL